MSNARSLKEIIIRSRGKGSTTILQEIAVMDQGVIIIAYDENQRREMIKAGGENVYCLGRSMELLGKSGPLLIDPSVVLRELEECERIETNLVNLIRSKDKTITILSQEIEHLKKSNRIIQTQRGIENYEKTYAQKKLKSFRITVFSIMIGLLIGSILKAIL